MRAVSSARRDALGLPCNGDSDGIPLPFVWPLAAGKKVDGFMRGKEDKEGGGTPRGYVCVADAREAWGLEGSRGDVGDNAKELLAKRLKGIDMLKT